MKSLSVKSAVGAFVLSCAMAGVAAPAGAMPALNGAVAAPASGVEKTRWVCGPFRCWWRPNPYFYGGGYGPGPGWGAYGGPQAGWGGFGGGYRRGWGGGGWGGGYAGYGGGYGGYGGGWGRGGGWGHHHHW